MVAVLGVKQNMVSCACSAHRAVLWEWTPPPSKDSLRSWAVSRRLSGFDPRRLMVNRRVTHSRLTDRCRAGHSPDTDTGGTTRWPPGPGCHEALQQICVFWIPGLQWGMPEVQWYNTAVLWCTPGFESRAGNVQRRARQCVEGLPNPRAILRSV